MFMGEVYLPDEILFERVLYAGRFFFGIRVHRRASRWGFPMRRFGLGRLGWGYIALGLVRLAIGVEPAPVLGV